MKKKDNTLQILTHILGLFLGFIGPLVILLVSKEKEVRKHAKVAINWHLSMIVYIIVSIVLMLVLVGFLTLFAFGFMNLIFCIVAAIKASEGELWEYPLSIKFLKI